MYSKKKNLLDRTAKAGRIDDANRIRDSPIPLEDVVTQYKHEHSDQCAHNCLQYAYILIANVFRGYLAVSEKDEQDHTVDYVPNRKNVVVVSPWVFNLPEHILAGIYASEDVNANCKVQHQPFYRIRLPASSK